jgi:hypothetical protein
MPTPEENQTLTEQPEPEVRNTCDIIVVPHREYGSHRSVDHEMIQRF